MGEYAKWNGESIKIGTCEEMHYLRADQRHLVQCEPGSVDPVAYEHELRFRFPFPDEDGVAPGAFKDYDRCVHIDGVEIPSDVDHGIVQFTAAPGWLLNFPCPLSAKGSAIVKTAELGLHKNGWNGDVKIVQQRILKSGAHAIVVACNLCGAKWRCDTLEEAAPYIEACEREAECERLRKGSAAEWWRKVAARIREGYEVKAETRS